MEAIQLDDKDVEVIVIANNSRERPYYLEAEYPAPSKQGRAVSCQSTGKAVQAGTIYSRARDTNTPIRNGVAPTTHIEKMWRQRFSLDESPLERMSHYLLDFNDWEEITSDKGGEYWYHKKFPEFTIERATEHSTKVYSHESWTRCALAPESYVYEVTFKYHQTILKTEIVLSYDDWRNYYPVPYNAEWSRLEKFGSCNFFYYYKADDFKFRYLQFSQKQYLTANSSIPAIRIPSPLVIFKDQKECDAFITYLCATFDANSVINQPFIDLSNFESNSKEIDILRIKFAT